MISMLTQDSGYYSHHHIPVTPVHDTSACLLLQEHTTIHPRSLIQYDCLDLDVADELRLYDAY